MSVWIIIGYLAGSNLPITSYVDYAYVSQDACELNRILATKVALADVRLQCQRIVVKK